MHEVVLGLDLKFDIAQARARSEDDADDELLCCAVAKSGAKVVTGSQSGVLSLYSWGFWNDCSDRFPGVFCCWAACGAHLVVMSPCKLEKVLCILPS